MKKISPSKKTTHRKGEPKLPIQAARQLHDGACQTLTAVQLLAKVMLRRMESTQSSDLPAMQELDGLLQKARRELGEFLQSLPND